MILDLHKDNPQNSSSCVIGENPNELQQYS